MHKKSVIKTGFLCRCASQEEECYSKYAHQFYIYDQGEKIGGAVSYPDESVSDILICLLFDATLFITTFSISTKAASNFNFVNIFEEIYTFFI